MKPREIEALRSTARSAGAFGSERALAAWLDVLAAAPGDPEATAAAGCLLVELERFQQGLALLEHALAAGAETGEVLFQRGIALSQLGRLDEAGPAFEAAQARLTGAPAARAHRNRISVLQRRGRMSEALALEESLGEPAAEDAEAWLHRGLSQVKAGRYDDCIESVRRALALHPRDASAHYTIACAYCLKGDVDAALESVKRAIEADPECAQAIADDADFATIKDDPRFRRLLAG